MFRPGTAGLLAGALALALAGCGAEAPAARPGTTLSCEAVNAAPASVAAAKRLLWDDIVGPIERVGRLENKMFTWAGHQPDAKEGVMAFLEKRDPVWRNSIDDVPAIE